MASRMNCRYRAPVPFTPLVATVLLASQSIGSRCDARESLAMSPDSSGRDRLDQHRFRPLGKMVVGNLDRILAAATVFENRCERCHLGLTLDPIKSLVLDEI